MRRWLAILLPVFFGADAAAQSVTFPSVAVGSIAAGPEISAQMYKPDGNGPFPGVVLAHTCAGVNRHTAVWGKLLSGWGYVVIAPDSFSPRGHQIVCGRGTLVSGSERVTDVAGAMDFLNAQPFVRKNDIGLIGHSHGGWTTMRAVQKSYGLAGRGLRAAVAYYPFCGAQFDRDVSVPLLILIGDKDDWTAADNCRRLEKAGFTRPELVQTVYYPDALHSFDAKGPDRSAFGHKLGYDAAAAPDAEARTRAFFDKYLR
jgi:dienelactone hydrolase